MKTTEEKSQIKNAKSEWKSEGLNNRIVVHTKEGFHLTRKLMTMSNRVNRELVIN